MFFFLKNKIKEDAHQVYSPLADEISKYKNMKFIVVSRFVGFNESNFTNRKINKFIQLIYYIFFALHIIKILFLNNNKKVLVREFSTFYLFFLSPLVFIAREKFIYIVNHNLQIAQNSFLQKLILKFLYRIGTRFLFFESSHGMHTIRKNPNNHQEIIAPFFIPNEIKLEIEDDSKFIKKINEFKSQNHLLISIPGRPTFSKGSSELLKYLVDYIKHNARTDLRFLIPTALYQSININNSHIKEYFFCPPDDSHKYYKQIIALSDVALFNYQSKYYNFRHSGVILDCLSMKTAVVCPNFPLLNHMINYPVKAGITFDRLKTLKFILNSHLNFTWLNSIDWGKYLEERSTKKIASKIVSKI